MHELATVLAKLYSEKDEVKPVVDRAQLDFSRIKSADQQYIYWFNVVEYADKLDRVDQLITTALEDFPDNPNLLKAKISWLEARSKKSLNPNQTEARQTSVQSEKTVTSLQHKHTQSESVFQPGTVSDGRVGSDASKRHRASDKHSDSGEVPRKRDTLELVGIAGIFISVSSVFAFWIGNKFPCLFGLTVHCESSKVPEFAPEMVVIQGGYFLMGSDHGSDNEKPVRRVMLDRFELARTEITVAQYAECVAENRCQEPRIGGKCTWQGLQLAMEEKTLPINCVSWNNAASYSKFISNKLAADVRLPTEAEWEYSARNGHTANSYPWGNDAPEECENAVTSVCGYDRVMPVCSKLKGNTTSGVCDLAGNLWEWVEDDFHKNYKGAPENGAPWIDFPRGSERVIRGGSYSYDPLFTRVSRRRSLEPDVQYSDVGFRIARSLPSAR